MKKLIILAVFFQLISCKDRAYVDYLPESTGPLNEVLWVADSTLVGTGADSVLRGFLQQRQLGLGVDEPILDIRRFDPSLFKGAVMKTRNIVVMSLDTLSTAHIKKDVYASNQHIAVLKGRNMEELKRNTEKIGRELVEKIKESDLEVAQERFLSSLNQDPRLREELGLSLVIPSIYRIGVIDKSFAWIDRPVENGSLNLVVYPLPNDRFQREDRFTDDLVEVRDSVGSVRIPGPDIPGVRTYIITEKIFRPYVFAAEVNGNKAAEVRGMWEMNGYPMAGPFVGYLVNDTLNQRKLMIEGFVFAPNHKKRDYLFELEAIIKTLKLSELK